MPYMAGVAAFGYFLAFAMFRPMHSKLIKESVASALLGFLTVTPYTYYYKRIWMTNVCTVYDDLRLAIKLNPALAKPDDDVAINKNFGPSKWNTGESGMDTDEEIEMDKEMDVFDD